MSRFINPFTDIGFKIIFGSEASKGLLIALLNELLSGEHHIEDLAFLNNEEHSDNIRDKGIIYDLYCRTSSGEYIIVEMQNRWHSCFLDRALYYVCRAVNNQIENPAIVKLRAENAARKKMSEGELCEPGSQTYGDNYELSTVYGIFLMNFKEPDLETKFRTDTVIADRDSHRVVNPHFRQIYLQFPYFTKELDECETLTDKLMYTMKNIYTWDRMPAALKEQVFQYLEKLAARANLSETDRIAYDRAMDKFRVDRIVEKDIRREAKKEGKEEGKEEIALQMKKDGLPSATIARYTGLSISEIERLK